MMNSNVSHSPNAMLVSLHHRDHPFFATPLKTNMEHDHGGLHRSLSFLNG